MNNKMALVQRRRREKKTKNSKDASKNQTPF